MTAAHRSLARLPLEIFESLVQSCDDIDSSSNAEDLRREIVTKLALQTAGSASNTSIGPRQTSSYGTVGGLLRLSPTALLRALDPLLTYQECQEFYRRTCLHCAPKPVSALQLLHQTYDTNMPPPPSSSRHASSTTSAVMRYLPTGLPALDEHLRGGIRIGTVTEVVGRAATAKSQLAMQMAVSAAAGYRQGSILVDTEKKLSIRRLQEIATARIATAADNNHAKLVLENVSVHSPDNMEELQTVLDSLEDEILGRNDDDDDNSNSGSSYPVRLLVIDSIAAPARREFGVGSAAAQAAAILQIAQTVKRLADQFQLAVLIINQVGGSSSSSNADTNNFQQQQQHSNTAIAFAPTVKAALGTAWHHCVSTRIQLEHHIAAAGQEQQQGVRHATVVKSNLVGPSAPLSFQVTTEGLVEY